MIRSFGPFGVGCVHAVFAPSVCVACGPVADLVSDAWEAHATWCCDCCDPSPDARGYCDYALAIGEMPPGISPIPQKG